MLAQINLPVIAGPAFYYKEGEAPHNLHALQQRVQDADGFVVISAEYNHGIPPALSNLMR